MILINS